MVKASSYFSNKSFVYSLAAIIIGMLLASCSDNSGETYDPPARAHSNADIIAETAYIDELLESDSRGFDAKVFDINTELFVRKQDQDLTNQNASINPIIQPAERKALYGDLHVHTTYSFDAYSMGTMATPYDAYRFAKGEPIKHAAGFDMQLTRPMDFYAVTDHGMFLGMAKAAAETDNEFSYNKFSQPYHNLNSPDNYQTDLISISRRLATFADFLPAAISQIQSGALDRNAVLKVVRSAWEDTIDAADEFNAPGEFTTFAAYEYTSSTIKMGNLHRNVIFKDTDTLPREPFSRFHSINPEDLWQWMDELRGKGVESIAIPHNSNGSNGQMFKLVDWAGNPLNDDYATQRMRNEPIVEITQIKGTSETHPVLSSRDEWASFEITPYRVATNALSAINGSYVREALLNGLQFEQSGISNPYQFGFIGSSDTHSGASQNDEANYVSKLGLLSGEAQQRGSVPRTGMSGNFYHYGLKAALALMPNPMGKSMSIKINGDIYSKGGTPTYGASGLAAAWAEANTRESIYQAFRRKEVFATSGPRIALRFFAGYDFDDSMLTEADGIERAYQQGVSMGANIVAADDNKIPSFLVMAAADAEAAPLQRLQVIKGWIDSSGETHEEVFDVACAGGKTVNPDTHRCPDNGARVDIADCSINPETGSTQLASLWQDPQFDSSQGAFYYARAIENPTCRWSTWDAIREGIKPRPDLPTTIQERAWSSPIHYITQAARRGLPDA